MAAGLGFKDFTTGEVLTAADVDGYLMQGVWVFADAAARDAAVTSPEEGNFAYLKDTDVTTYYTGSAWANLDTTGMTNPMTTTGDTIYSSSGSTPARLGIGGTGDVLTVAGGVPSWAVPAGGSTFVGVSCKANANQTIANNTYTNITFNQENFDTDTFHDNTTDNSRITIPAGKAGYYQISAYIQCDASAAGSRNLYLNKNGSTITYNAVTPSASSPFLQLNFVADLSVGDYIEMQVLQDSGGNATFLKAYDAAGFSAFLIGV